jgi:hypothetical protein
MLAQTKELEEEIKDLKQEVFNSECERNKLELRVEELNGIMEGKRDLLNATEYFDNVDEIVRGAPACIQRILAS